MLKIPTFVAPSAIAGMGLFSGIDLRAGTVIWEFSEGVDWRITPAKFEAFPEPFLSRMRHYVYLDDTGVFVLCGDNAKFMNHADDPNCEDPDPSHTVTLRDVKAGDELTCDYRQIDMESRQGGLAFDGVTLSRG